MITYCVAVVTKNRPKILFKCLSNIFNQDLMPNQIIVVDASENDESKKLIRKSFPCIDYFKLKLDSGSQPRLRNLAIKNCNTDILAFVDDDGFAKKKWLKKLDATYKKNPNIVGVGGRIIQGKPVRLNSNNISKVCGLFDFYRWSSGSSNIIGNKLIEVKHFQGTNMSFKLKALKSIGGWDEKLCHGYASFEETDVCLRLYLSGKKLIFNPKAVVVHGLAPREKGYSRDMSTSSKFVYSFARNGAYVTVKNFKKNLKAHFAVLFLSPIVNFKRIFSNPGENLKISNLMEVNRYLIFVNFCLGLFQGYKLSISS